MFDEVKARRVGAVMIVLVAAAAAAVLLVDCARLRPAIRVTAYFAHIGPLAEGADLEIAGQVVGEVTAVQLVPARAASDPAHPLHPEGGVAVHLRIQRRFASRAPRDGELFITAKGVLGEAYLALVPPSGGTRASSEDTEHGANRDETPLQDGDHIRGIDPVRMEEVVVRGFHNMTAFRRLLDDIAPPARELRAALEGLAATLEEIEPAAGAYGELQAALGRTGDQLDRLTGGWDQAGTSPAAVLELADRAGQFLDQARADLGGTAAALARLQADLTRIRGHIPDDLGDQLQDAIARARLAVGKLERLIASAQDLATRVRRGHGTIGALLNDPEFIDDAKQLGKVLKRQPWRVLGRPTREALEKQLEQ